MPLGDLWPAGCWDRTGVVVVAAGFCWVCTVLNFFRGVGWVCERFVGEYVWWYSRVGGHAVSTRQHAD